MGGNHARTAEPQTRRMRRWALALILPVAALTLVATALLWPTEGIDSSDGLAAAQTPVVIWGGDKVLRNPTNARVAELVGLRAPMPQDAVCDLLVVGAGPAGLAAGVYGSSEGLATGRRDLALPPQHRALPAATGSGPDRTGPVGSPRHRRARRCRLRGASRRQVSQVSLTPRQPRPAVSSGPRPPCHATER